MVLQKNNPIGIFDSGIGGLTVANAVFKLLPEENIIYFGDTAHLPYGDKSPKAIQYYSQKIAEFLLKKNCKLIVIACNTASSFAYKHLLKELGEKVEIINVVDPVVNYVIEKDVKKIGVIGTKGTIQSNIYEEKILALKKNIFVQSLATPLFAPMIEEGFINCDISKTVIKEYLSNKKLQQIDALILACTHYPIIKEELISYYSNKTEVIDSASIVALSIKEKLRSLDLLNSRKINPHQFYVSDPAPFFEKIAKVFFKENIRLEYYPLWDI